MKGKTSVYFSMPNLGRLRSRIENAPKSLTQDLRNKLTEILVKVMNDSSLRVRSEFIAYIETREDLKFKSPEHKKQVMNLFSGIFDSIFAVDANTLNVLTGEADDTEEGAEAEATELEAETAAPKAKKARAKKSESEEHKDAEGTESADAGSASGDSPVPGDEFED